VEDFLGKEDAMRIIQDAIDLYDQTYGGQKK
jgi:hypothetical protein